MAIPPLSNQQIRSLKSQVHALKPVVRVGQHGVSDAVLAELEGALDHHELLKVKVSTGDRDERDQIITIMAEKTSATVVQRIGNMVVFYRKKPADAQKNKKRASPGRARSTKR